MRSAVVLPEPDGPTSTMNSPSAIVQVERVDGRRRRCPGRSASPASKRTSAIGSASRPSMARARTARRPRRARCAAAALRLRAGAELVERRAAPRRRSAATPATPDRESRARARASPRSITLEQALVARAAGAPPPSSTSTGSLRQVEPRRAAARTSATTSAASRSTISAATASSAASAKTSGGELDHAAHRDPPEVDRLGELARRREPEVRRHGAARGSSAGHGRPRCAPPRESAAMPTSEPPPQSPVISPSAGKRACAPVGGDADAVDARRRRRRRRPSRARCPRGARRTCRCRRWSAPPSRAPRCALAHRVLLGREVDAGEQQLGDLGDGPLDARAASRRASASSCSSTARQPVEPEVVRRAERPAHEREHRAVLAHEREVGLRVAAVDGEDERLAHRRAAGSGREQRARAAVDELVLADQRMREQRLARDVPGRRVTRRLDREPLVGGDVLRRARAAPARAAPAGAAYAPCRVDARRHLDHVVVGEARERARRCGRRRRGRRRRPARARRRARSPPRCRRRRRAARAARASRSAPGRGRARAARARSRPRPCARGIPSSCSASTCVVRVEVAQVVGRDRAELVEQPARQLDLGRELVAVLGQQRGQHVLAVDAHGADPGQVVEARPGRRRSAPARRRAARRTCAGSRSRRCRARRRGAPRRAARA